MSSVHQNAIKHKGWLLNRSAAYVKYSCSEKEQGS